MAVTVNAPNGVTILENNLDDKEQPNEEEVLEYALFLGIDPEKEPHLMHLARQGVVAPVPLPWKACTENGDDVFYFNFETGESVWDHPMDEKFRQMVEQERQAHAGAAPNGQQAREELSPCSTQKVSPEEDAAVEDETKVKPDEKSKVAVAALENLSVFSAERALQFSAQRALPEEDSDIEDATEVKSVGESKDVVDASTSLQKAFPDEDSDVEDASTVVPVGGAKEVGAASTSLEPKGHVVGKLSDSVGDDDAPITPSKGLSGVGLPTTPAQRLEDLDNQCSVERGSHTALAASPCLNGYSGGKNSSGNMSEVSEELASEFSITSASQGEQSRRAFGRLADTLEFSASMRDRSSSVADSAPDLTVPRVSVTMVEPIERREGVEKQALTKAPVESSSKPPPTTDSSEHSKGSEGKPAVATSVTISVASKVATTEAVEVEAPVVQEVEPAKVDVVSNKGDPAAKESNGTIAVTFLASEEYLSPSCVLDGEPVSQRLLSEIQSLARSLKMLRDIREKQQQYLRLVARIL